MLHLQEIIQQLRDSQYLQDQFEALVTQTRSIYIPLTVVGKEKKEARKEIRRDTKVMLEEAEQDIDGETAEEVDAVGKQEGRI